MPASVARSPSALMRPCSSVGTLTTRPRPRPSICSDAKTETCDSSLVTTASGGAPTQPPPPTPPPALPRQRVAGRGERGKVRHRPAGDKTDAALFRQAEEIEKPTPRDLLGGCGGRRQNVKARVLIPDRS